LQRIVKKIKVPFVDLKYRRKGELSINAILKARRNLFRKMEHEVLSNY
jgi:hypothetical protein